MNTISQVEQMANYGVSLKAARRTRGKKGKETAGRKHEDKDGEQRV